MNTPWVQTERRRERKKTERMGDGRVGGWEDGGMGGWEGGRMGDGLNHMSTYCESGMVVHVCNPST